MKDVSDALSKEKVFQYIKLANDTLKKAGVENPKIGVAALNPHAAESGLCGTEEIEIIAPAIKMAAEQGINVVGPISSDIIFIKAFKGEFHAAVTMFHDQGQIALKLKAFEKGITIGGGLKIPITTSGHGSAYDIAWQGIANENSLLNALKMVSKMCEKYISS